MANELKTGKEVYLKMPYGDFIIRDNVETVLVAGGTGITAFTSLITDKNKEFNNRISLLYGARSKELLIYKDEINENINVKLFAENCDDENIISGKLSCEEVIHATENPQDTKFYFSGPPQMLKSFVEKMHNEYKISEENLLIDAWE